MKAAAALVGLESYPFVRLAEAKRRLLASGVDLIDFGIGEPREPTPAFIREALVAAASACHMLMYLHLCADAGIVVTAYEDAATGVMVEEANGGGRFRSILLAPKITLAPGSDRERARLLHAEAHRLCFVANSLSAPIGCEPSFTEAAG